MWFGHILLPILIYLLTNKTLNIYALIFGSLLLNLDTIPPTLKLVSKEFHMGIIHTPFFIILTSIPVFLYDLVLGLSFLLGGLSHILADTGTDTGIMWFYPVLLTKAFELKVSAVKKNLIVMLLFILQLCFAQLKYVLPTVKLG